MTQVPVSLIENKHMHMDAIFIQDAVFIQDAFNCSNRNSNQTGQKKPIDCVSETPKDECGFRESDPGTQMCCEAFASLVLHFSRLLV